MSRTGSDEQPASSSRIVAKATLGRMATLFFSRLETPDPKAYTSAEAVPNRGLAPRFELQCLDAAREIAVADLDAVLARLELQLAQRRADTDSLAVDVDGTPGRDGEPHARRRGGHRCRRLGLGSRLGGGRGLGRDRRRRGAGRALAPLNLGPFRAADRLDLRPQGEPGADQQPEQQRRDEQGAALEAERSGLQQPGAHAPGGRHAQDGFRHAPRSRHVAADGVYLVCAYVLVGARTFVLEQARVIARQAGDHLVERARNEQLVGHREAHDALRDVDAVADHVDLAVDVTHQAHRAQVDAESHRQGACRVAKRHRREQRVFRVAEKGRPPRRRRCRGPHGRAARPPRAPRVSASLKRCLNSSCSPTDFREYSAMSRKSTLQTSVRPAFSTSAQRSRSGPCSREATIVRTRAGACVIGRSEQRRSIAERIARRSSRPLRPMQTRRPWAACAAGSASTPARAPTTCSTIVAPSGRAGCPWRGRCRAPAQRVRRRARAHRCAARGTSRCARTASRPTRAAAASWKAHRVLPAPARGRARCRAPPRTAAARAPRRSRLRPAPASRARPAARRAPAARRDRLC